MKITFAGAAGTVTGSQHLLEINGRKILLDCGFYQGRRGDTYARNVRFPFDPASLDAVILSHAHIDHSGNLPNLTKQGFRGNIYSTPATRDLCQIMLADSARIQAADIKFVNKKREREGLPPAEPIYTPQDAELCLRNFVTIDYRRRLPVSDGVTLEFIDAGHILGAAQVVLDIDENGKKRRLLFSGDIGRGKNDLLRDPEHAGGVDLMIMESTYGASEHETPTRSQDRLCEIINRALERKGKILIPSFAVERTQQLLYILHQVTENRCIPSVPIYVDSPLAVNATEIFRLHPECFNDEVYQFLFEKRDPFGIESLTMIRDVRQSMKLNEIEGPAIIIAASGMCEAGRILHHLRNNIGDPRTTVLFVGYCATDTLGWKIRQGFKRVNIFGEEFQVNAAIEAIDSFSGHADRSELLDYFNGTGGPKSRVWLVHGEPANSAALRDALPRDGSRTIEVAELGQTVEA
jgi:metallo-beta-lactamase family protein